MHCCVLCCLVIAFLWLHFFLHFFANICTFLHFFALHFLDSSFALPPPPAFTLKEQQVWTGGSDFSFRAYRRSTGSTITGGAPHYHHGIEA